MTDAAPVFMTPTQRIEVLETEIVKLQNQLESQSVEFQDQLQAQSISFQDQIDNQAMQRVQLEARVIALEAAAADRSTAP